jgi:D-glycero-alpha-D-manno-heptose 1-phosphate guanylyltransferase
MEALILAGGLGTRLALAVSDRAKPVADVAGRPFLVHLLRQLERCSSIDRVTLCVGHKSDTVQRALGERFARLPLRYSLETEPLGTGGALRHALEGGNAKSACIAMNGDSFLGISLDRLLAFHREAPATVSLALARVSDAMRFEVKGDRIVAFREKGRGGPAWINAGIYVLSPRAQRALCDGPKRFSFEQDMLRAWCAGNEARGMKSRARFLDIGTPEDYARAASVLSRS